MGKDKPTEESCLLLVDKDADIPDACKQFMSVRKKLDAKMDPFAGMAGGAKGQVRNAQIKRRMSTRHGQGKDGKKSSWF